MMETYEVYRPTGPGILQWTVAALLLAAAQWTAAETGRWYTGEQVARGAEVFAQNCAECHGANAEATPEWRKRNPEGQLPPPPLNGSAHAWHHPLDMLRRTIRTGGAPVGGVMPPFSDKLTSEEIDAAIAFFQDKWSDEIYLVWQERDGQSAAPRPVKAKPPAADHSAMAILRQRMPQADIGEPTPTPVAGVLQVKVGKDYVYVTKDGQFAFLGDLVNLAKGSNLTESLRGSDNLALIDGFPEASMVVYPADGTEIASITVFTDISCPYCRKLHQEVPRLTSKGVTVRYIAFPRAGPRGEVHDQMRSIWCADDQREAMDIAKGVAIGDLGSGSCEAGGAVASGYRLGVELGVRGTPAIVLPNGQLLPGYVPADKLLARLGISIDKLSSNIERSSP